METTRRDLEIIDPIEPEFEEHSIWTSIALHLLPGIVGGLVYYLTAPFLRARGYPTVSALILAGLVVLSPLELAILFYFSRKKGQSLRSLLAYQQPLPLGQYLLWVSIVIVSSGLIMTLFNPLSATLMGLFKWIPGDLILDLGLSGGFARPKLILTYGLFLLFGVLIGPLVEELYFRGFLLPRLPRRLGGWSPLVHSFLFALYHTWTPWMFAARTAGLLPLIYGVRHKRNLWIGIIAHCLLNSLDLFAGVAFIFSLA